jgi:hypothetical protein
MHIGQRHRQLVQDFQRADTRQAGGHASAQVARRQMFKHHIWP